MSNSRSMQNLKNLVRLDIGNNKFTDLVSEHKCVEQYSATYWTVERI